MLRIFQGNTSGYSWGNRINFVDDNNVLVGFDNESSCCENFGWSITSDVLGDRFDYADEGDTLDYHFDPKFYQYGAVGTDYPDEGLSITFRLISDDGEEDLYLHLWNYHNGYYGHGFNFQIGEGDDHINIESGTL